MTILYIIIIIVMLLMIVAFFAARNFVVVRTFAIQKPAPEIFEYLRYLQNHKRFSKWTSKEFVASEATKGTDGTVGFIQPWNNYKDKAGIGELEIRELIDNKRLNLVHHYFKPVKGVGESEITIEPESDLTSLVRWQYTGHTPYPLNLLTSIMNMDKIIGSDLEICLSKLNQQLNLKN
jgi:hypothetical protein